MNLFNQKPKRARRVCRVENLGGGNTSIMRVSEDQKSYTVCLCIVNNIKKTVFTNEAGALSQMEKYSAEYKK